MNMINFEAFAKGSFYSSEWMALLMKDNFSVKTSFQIVYSLWISIFSS